MVERSTDWLNQAKRDLEQAKSSLKSEFYEWGCLRKAAFNPSDENHKED